VQKINKIVVQSHLSKVVHHLEMMVKAELSEREQSPPGLNGQPQQQIRDILRCKRLKKVQEQLESYQELL